LSSLVADDDVEDVSPENIIKKENKTVNYLNKK
jgi:hypothetical protein